MSKITRARVRNFSFTTKLLIGLTLFYVIAKSASRS